MTFCAVVGCEREAGSWTIVVDVAERLNVEVALCREHERELIGVGSPEPYLALVEKHDGGTVEP